MSIGALSVDAAAGVAAFSSCSFCSVLAVVGVADGEAGVVDDDGELVDCCCCLSLLLLLVLLLLLFCFLLLCLVSSLLSASMVSMPSSTVTFRSCFDTPGTDACTVYSLSVDIMSTLIDGTTARDDSSEAGWLNGDSSDSGDSKRGWCWRPRLFTAVLLLVLLVRAACLLLGEVDEADDAVGEAVAAPSLLSLPAAPLTIT